MGVRKSIRCSAELKIHFFTMSGGLFALMNKKGREERRMKELREAFDAADKDGDGKLNPEEWLSVLKVTGVEANWEDVQRLFGEKDRDHDGFLSFEEFTGQETKIEMAFKAMDKDGTGMSAKRSSN